MRYFSGTGESAGAEWRWDGREMFISDLSSGWETSLFASPGALLSCLDVVETDEDGNRLRPTREDIAAEKGDREQQRIQDDR